MQIHYCKIKPVASLHLGERETWQEGSGTFIHADTLFSAIFSAFCLLFSQEQALNFVEMVKTSRVRFSSAFPYWKGQLFWPIPKNQIPKSKEQYQLKFIETKGFERLLSGEMLDQVLHSNPETIPATAEPYYPWFLETVPRISLDRIRNKPAAESGLFHMGRVTYADYAGLYFLFHCDQDALLQQLKAALRLVADEGIGGDRSCGHGLFAQPEFAVMDLATPDQTDGSYLLSVFYPSKEDPVADFANGFYDLVERKGYIYSPMGKSLRRSSVRMVAEGAILPGGDWHGDVVDLQPQNLPFPHPVYRYGKYWGIPCKKEVA